MNIWRTNTGKQWLRNFLTLCNNPQHKLLVVKGGIDFSLLYDARLKIPQGEIININTPEKLDNLGTTNENRIILLDSLICSVNVNVDMGLKKARTFCRAHGYTFMFAPYAFTSADLAHLEAENYENRQNVWLASISHWTAASISHGVMQCYAMVKDIFDSLEVENPDKLPSASDCQKQYMENVRHLPAYDSARRFFLNQSASMLQNPQNPTLDAWLILWSVGLSGMMNGQWELAPVLLEGPGMVGEKMHRVIDANHINIPPIYMAWVYYCERKYKLYNDPDNPIVRYPIDVKTELSRLQHVDESDLKMCENVRILRNWLQHGENDSRSVYQNDIMCLYTCKTIINRLSRDGKERS